MVDFSRILVVVAILIVAIAVQSALFPQLFKGAHPDLMLAITAGAGLVGGPGLGCAIGLINGLLIDLLTGRLVGLTMITLAVAGVVSGRLAGRLYKENPFVPFVIGVLATVVNQLLFIFAARAFGVVIPIVDSLIHIILPSIWYNGLLTALAFPGIYRLYNHFVSMESVRL
jgi:rod shape-determining protein MreD